MTGNGQLVLGQLAQAVELGPSALAPVQLGTDGVQLTQQLGQLGVGQLGQLPGHRQLGLELGQSGQMQEAPIGGRQVAFANDLPTGSLQCGEQTVAQVSPDPDDREVLLDRDPVYAVRWFGHVGIHQSSIGEILGNSRSPARPMSAASLGNRSRPRLWVKAGGLLSVGTSPSLTDVRVEGAGMSVTKDDGFIEPWLPHEQPERPFDKGTWICECRACLWGLQAEARYSPHTPLCIKSGFDRVIVSAEYLAETLVAGSSIESLLYVVDDWVREVFVPVGSWRWQSAQTRWWSLMRHEDEDIAGIGHVRHQVARGEDRTVVDLRFRYFVDQATLAKSALADTAIAPPAKRAGKNRRFP